MSLAAIGLGANLPSRAGLPAATLAAALDGLADHGQVVARSSLYRTAPVGIEDQPEFLNAAVLLQTKLAPGDLMTALLEVERRFGRDRMLSAPKGPRPLDLDLLWMDGFVLKGPALTLPHPAMHERRFVLAPLLEIAPGWRHPLLHHTIAELLVALPENARDSVKRVNEREWSEYGVYNRGVSLDFSILASAGAGRRGVLDLPHSRVQTPVFMPVGTAGSVKAVPQHLLEQLGAEIILGNTYHLYLRPGHELVQRMGGLHRFISWPRALLTDSGGFQVFSLNELRKVTTEGVRFRSHLDGSSHVFSPERSIEIQIALGADILMVFDECTEYPADRERARRSLELTLQWAARSQTYFEEHKQDVPWFAELGGRTQSLFGIVQGGMYPELRRESAERLIEMDFPGYAIGGLSVGEPRELTREIIASTLPLLPVDKPRYVMGVGYPDEIVEYAAMGVDMMDCVLPTRAARHGLLFTSEGRLNIKNKQFAEDQGPPDPVCGCMVCGRYTRAYLRHLMVAQEPLSAVLNTLHNLAFYLDTMAHVRERLGRGLAIHAGQQPG